MLGHGGDTNQFHSAMSLLPEHGLGVFVSYNSDPASAARGNVVAAFLDHHLRGERQALLDGASPRHREVTFCPAACDLGARGSDDRRSG